MEPQMRHLSALFPRTTFKKELYPLSRSAKLVAVLACLVPLLCGAGLAQTMSTFAGLNTTNKGGNQTAAPDVTIAVGTLEYCEHVNSLYQCWYKSGVNANQPVSFSATTAPSPIPAPGVRTATTAASTDSLSDRLLSELSVARRQRLQPVDYGEANHGFGRRPWLHVRGHQQRRGCFLDFACLELVRLRIRSGHVIPTNSHGHFYYPTYPQTGLWRELDQHHPPTRPLPIRPCGSPTICRM